MTAPTGYARATKVAKDDSDPGRKCPGSTAAVTKSNPAATTVASRANRTRERPGATTLGWRRIPRRMSDIAPRKPTSAAPGNGPLGDRKSENVRIARPTLQH